jgi:acyl-CoA reductase-like NAD-dependent aldehyde dehydrogenase
MTFGTEDEALRLANDTRYGLAASVWTSDLSRALKFTRSVRAGMVWVNSHGDTDEAVSVGGVKASGYGRELGLHSREQYTVTRSVWLSRG